MAQVGLKYPVYAKYAEAGGVVSYTDGDVIGKAISASLSWTQNTVDLWADDGVAETDSAIQYGTVTIGVDELSDETLASLLGHTLTEEDELVYGDGQAPYVGVGFYGKVIKGGVAKWRCVWLPKVKFGIPGETFSTKGETLSFQTPTIEGRITRDAGGNLYHRTLIATEEAAIAYLKGKAGIGVTP